MHARSANHQRKSARAFHPSVCWREAVQRPKFQSSTSLSLLPSYLHRAQRLTFSNWDLMEGETRFEHKFMRNMGIEIALVIAGIDTNLAE
jgi:hypothetical protein